MPRRARQAVKDVILELLTNPELRSLIAGPAPAAQAAPPAPARPGPWTRLKAACTAAKEAVAIRCKAAATAAAAALTPSAAALTPSAVMPVKQIVLVGAGAGLAVGVASYLCPHAVSAAIGGVGGMCTAVGVQAARWVRRSAGLLGLGKG